jgi:hypothetical protein
MAVEFDKFIPQHLQEIRPKLMHNDVGRDFDEKIGSAIHAFFAPLGGVDLPETTREIIRRPPAFAE